MKKGHGGLLYQCLFSVSAETGSIRFMDVWRSLGVCSYTLMHTITGKIAVAALEKMTFLHNYN